MIIEDKPNYMESYETRSKDRMITGIPGLDHLLRGGIVRSNSLLIEGPPGSGKSTLGVQILVRGAELFQEPGVMVAFEEFPRQLYAEYRSYGFDLKKLEDQGLLRVIWTDPRKVISSFTGKDDLIGKIIEEMGARRLLIDSITHFRRVASADIDLREVLYRILNNLKLKGVNAILIKELERNDESTIAFEEYVVDASIRILNYSVQGTSENKRAIEIRKTRGQEHISGTHSFEFKPDGIHLYPHLRPVDLSAAIPEKPRQKGRVPSGVKGLDELIEGGFPIGSINVLAGYAGTGKSTFGRHFIHAALKRGQRALVISFQESQLDFEHAGNPVGLSFSPYFNSGQLDYWALSPIGLLVDSFILKWINLIIKQDYQVVFLDSLSDLRASIQDFDLLREIYYLMAMLLKRAGLTCLLTADSEEIGGLIRINELDFAKLADSVIQLSFAEINGRVHRFLGIMKMSGTDHAKELREFRITNCGMQIEAMATGLSGILSGHAAGRFEAVAEHVLDPLMESSQSVAEVLKDPGLSAEQRQKLVAAREKIGLADIVLREHFGLTNLASVVEELAEG